MEVPPMISNATEVYPGLWVGAAPPPGHYWARVDVMVFVAKELPRPDPKRYPGVVVRWYPFDDSMTPSESDIEQALRGARAVSEDLAAGRKVLVTCQMGRNRSAFVAALALHILTGASGRVALRQVRMRRKDAVGVRAISNPAFQKYLLEL
jgi:protein-tyrosine phosphatase